MIDQSSVCSPPPRKNINMLRLVILYELIC